MARYTIYCERHDRPILLYRMADCSGVYEFPNLAQCEMPAETMREATQLAAMYRACTDKQGQFGTVLIQDNKTKRRVLAPRHPNPPGIQQAGRLG